MYGIPADVDWKFIIGKELLQLRIGRHHVSLRLAGDTAIGVECDFEHTSHPAAAGASLGLAGRATTLISLLGSRVVEVTRDGERALVLSFSNGEQLRLIDSNEHFESFQVTARGLTIIV